MQEKELLTATLRAKTSNDRMKLNPKAHGCSSPEKLLEKNIEKSIAWKRAGYKSCKSDSRGQGFFLQLHA